MVTRRTLLRLAVGSTLGMTASLAGCNWLPGPGSDAERALRIARERLGQLASDLETHVAERTAFEDVDAQQQLDDIDEALTQAEERVQSDEQRAQLRTLQTLRDVLGGVVDALASANDDGRSGFEAALRAHGRTEDHYVETRLNEHGEVLNPGETTEMSCLMTQELRDANRNLRSARDVFDAGVTTVDAAGADYDPIAGELSAYDEIDAEAVRTVLDESRRSLGAMTDLCTGIIQSDDAEIASHAAGIRWNEGWNPGMTADLDACDVDFDPADVPAVEQDPDAWATYLEDEIQPRYEQSRDGYADARETLEGLDQDALPPGADQTAQAFACMAPYQRESAAHRVAAIDARLTTFAERGLDAVLNHSGQSEQRFAEETHAAFDAQEAGARACG